MVIHHQEGLAQWVAYRLTKLLQDVKQGVKTVCSFLFEERSLDCETRRYLKGFYGFLIQVMLFHVLLESELSR